MGKNQIIQNLKRENQKLAEKIKELQVTVEKSFDNRLKSLKHIPFPVYLWKKRLNKEDFILTEINQLASSLGVDEFPTDLIQSAHQFFTSDLQASIFSLLLDSLRNRSQKTIELEFPNPKLSESRFMKIFCSFIFPDHIVMIVEDVSSQKLNEVGYNRLLDIFEVTTDFIATAKPNGDLTYINKLGKRMVDLDPNTDVTGLTIADFHPPWAYELVMKEGIPKAIERGYWHGETAIMRTNGIKIPVSQAIMAHYRSDGSLEYLSTIMRDITRVKAVETELKEQKNLFQSLFEGLKDAIYIHTLPNDEDPLKILQVNDYACNLMGYSRQEFTEMHFGDIHANQDMGETKYIFEAIFQNKVATFERVHVTKVGTKIPVEIHSHMQTLGEKKVVFSSARDISERKIVESRLIESEAKYRAFFQNLPFGFAYHEVIVDENNNPIDYRYIDINSAFETLTGINASEAVGRTVREVLPGTEDDPADWIGTFGRVGLTGEPTVVEEFSEQINRWFQVFGYSPKRGYFGVFFRDITEEKKQEAEKMRVQKLESLGILAGGLAHDFNNILVGILGNINLIQLQKDRLDPELLLHLNDLELAAKRATDITKQLLTFAKGGEPLKKPEHILDIIKFARQLVMSGSKSKCVVHVHEELPAVNVDVGQIQQVINNLIINADQSMKDGGIIDITLSKIFVEAPSSTLDLNPGQYVKISLKDQGSGIPLGIRDKIFTPYFSTKKTGSGLGLATSFSIIKRHGGQISFVSNENEGTEFTLYLPAIELPPSQMNPQKNPELTKHGKILILEDDITVQKVIGKIMDKLGQKIKIVDDGAEVIAEYKNAQLSDEPYDLVILDLTIPGGMGGKKAIEKLITLDPDITALVSSGYSTNLVMANYREYGFADILQKPYTINQVKNVLEKYLNH